MISIALAKGRLADKTIEILNKCGVDTACIDEKTRKLIFESEDEKYRFFLVKPMDVPTFVEYGIADIGIVGKDNLLEQGKDVYEMIDLDIAKCSLCIAGKKGNQDILKSSRLTVGTKYVNVAKQLFLNRGNEVEIISLCGSVELSVAVGMCDVILDIVESGATLKANDLEVFEKIYDISARLVVNKVSLKTKAEEILPLLKMVKENI